MHDIRTCYDDLGDPTIRKWAPRIQVAARNVTNVSLQIRVDNDNQDDPGDLKELTSLGQHTWEQSGIPWGSPEIFSDQSGLMLKMRRFPRGKMRCTYRQIRIGNALTNIYKSDDFGNVVISSTTATLFNSAAYDWPEEVVDYYLAFEHDNYTENFLITARTADALTFTDTNGTAPSGNKKWIIRGYAKGHLINLESFAVYYVPISPSFEPFMGLEVENAS
jgi:hypothetical protein